MESIRYMYHWALAWLGWLVLGYIRRTQIRYAEILCYRHQQYKRMFSRYPFTNTTAEPRDAEEQLKRVFHRPFVGVWRWWIPIENEEGPAPALVVLYYQHPTINRSPKWWLLET